MNDLTKLKLRHEIDAPTDDRQELKATILENIKNRIKELSFYQIAGTNMAYVIADLEHLQNYIEEL